MDTTVQKWGNSLAVRIPRSLAKDIRLNQGMVVDVIAVGGKIVVKPRERQRYTLTQLLKGVTTRNRHAEVEWGGRVGQEVW
ncbi:MAG: AbrB/MazE/SpoVT family DNA-binding domain-containing protein [Candidatus Omnitrophica bacterium]|nr:AbrB/MazE/SpoVT family DNA-binding domain-containing protein [Candidatus Omnitrophota bacterium]